MTTMSLRLPDSIHRQLKALAKREGVSLNHVVTIAVAEKTAESLTIDYLEHRAARGDRAKFEAALSTVPDTEAEMRDRMPAPNSTDS